jgi:hypothetical protein
MPPSPAQSRRANPGESDRGSVVEYVAVVGAVLTMLALLLLLGVRWLAAEAAAAASQRALEIAQAPGGTTADAEQVATRLATSVRLVAGVDVTVTRTADDVTVTVTAHSRLGGAVSTSATGPLIRFIPQTQTNAP